MPGRIAIVGMACRYPDAESPEQLWENVLAQRRAFRRIPGERLSLRDYGSSDPHAPDLTYVDHTAVLEGFEFDRVRFRVSGSTYRAADLTHWLALDVADRALKNAGFADADGLPRERSGVILGNTLTGGRVLRVRRVADMDASGRNGNEEGVAFHGAALGRRHAQGPQDPELVVRRSTGVPSILDCGQYGRPDA